MPGLLFRRWSFGWEASGVRGLGLQALYALKGSDSIALLLADLACLDHARQNVPALIPLTRSNRKESRSAKH
jgi:hypothetical protein